MSINSCGQTIIFLQVYYYQPKDYCPGQHSVLVYQGTACYLNPRHNNHHHYHHHPHPEKQHWGNILKAFIGCRHSQWARRISRGIGFLFSFCYPTTRWQLLSSPSTTILPSSSSSSTYYHCHDHHQISAFVIPKPDGCDHRHRHQQHYCHCHRHHHHQHIIIATITYQLLLSHNRQMVVIIVIAFKNIAQYPTSSLLISNIFLLSHEMVVIIIRKARL